MLRSVMTAVALLVLMLAAQAQAQVTGRVDEGKKEWAVAMRCNNCHGANGEGGFGPDLAGRGLSLEQFRRAVREPWGIMPAYSAKQLSDQAVADMWAFTSSLPKTAQVGKPRFATAAGAPAGQVQLVETLGCASCHGPEVRFPRQVLGRDATDLNFEHFAEIIYQHDLHFPEGRMGSYSKVRVPESLLREVYWFIREDLGLLATMQTTLTQGTVAGANSTHTLTLRNNGTVGKGLTTEELTVSLRLPDGSTIADANGAVATARDGVASWKVAKVLPGQEFKYTVTVPGAPRPAADLVRQSRVEWLKPAMRPGVPNLQLTDERWAGSRNDWGAVTVAPVR